MSVANRGKMLATVLNIAGIRPVEARHALHRRMTTMNRKNLSKLHEQWQTPATLNKKPKTGSMEWQEKVMR